MVMDGRKVAGLEGIDIDKLGAAVAVQFLVEQGYALIGREEAPGCAARLFLDRRGAVVMADVEVGVGDGRSHTELAVGRGRLARAEEAARRWLAGPGAGRALRYDVVEVVFASAAEAVMNHYSGVDFWGW